jgi:NRAMP (natural resistance-associated macrophage protein)-like metal ion transporter
VTGAADDDPSGIGTYSQVGAAFGFRFLWTALASLPLAIAVQEASARLGLFSGKGLAVLIKQEFPKWVLYLALTLVVGANSFNIGADLGSMAAATRLLIPIPQAILVVGFASAMAFLEIAIPYRQYSKVLRWLCISILSYVLVLFIVNVSWHDVLRNLLIPSFGFKRAEIAAVIAVFGTTISPYLFFWQTSEEVEEGPVKTGDSAQHVKTHLRSMRGDVTAGMFSGVFVMFAIMVTSAATLHAHGIINIGTAEDAARALEPLAGSSAKVLFALGIVGTGLLAVPVLAGASSYAISEALGWREGLSLKMSQAKGFYYVILGSMLVGLAMNFIGLNPVRALYLSAVLNGLAAPPLIVMILLLSRRKHVLGEHTSGKISQFGLGMAALVSATLPIAFIFAR